MFRLKMYSLETCCSDVQLFTKESSFSSLKSAGNYNYMDYLITEYLFSCFLSKIVRIALQCTPRKSVYTVIKLSTRLFFFFFFFF